MSKRDRSPIVGSLLRGQPAITGLLTVWIGGAIVIACSESATSDPNVSGNGGTTTAAGGSSAATRASGSTNSTGGQPGSGGTTRVASSGGGIESSSGGSTAAATTRGGREGAGASSATAGSLSASGGGRAMGGTTAFSGSSVGGQKSTGGVSASGGTKASGAAPSTAGTRAMGGTAAGGAAAGAPGAAGTAGAAAGAGSGVIGPCDIYGAANTPCVAAHSTVRALYGKYTGKLYQVQRASDKQTKDILVLSAGGYADSASQDAFCLGTTCTISIIYDQSPKANDLKPAPGGGAVSTPDQPVTANKLKLTVGGHSVHAAYFEGGQGYRNNSKTTGLAKNDEPESMYMVASGKHYNDKCCWDYGNAETTNNDDGEGTMEAIYFGDCSFWGKGSGNGPWIMADIENGLWAGNTTPNNKNTPMTAEYITAMVKGKPHTLAIKGGNAQAGNLTTFWEGAYPAKGATGKPYDPMKKQGAIILGIGGDNSNGGVGTFFEGCITTGYASAETDEAIQANIIAAGYGK